MMNDKIKQTLQMAALLIIVFLATIAVCEAIQNGTFAGPSLADDIEGGFGQIVQDRHAGDAG